MRQETHETMQMFVSGRSKLILNLVDPFLKEKLLKCLEQSQAPYCSEEMVVTVYVEQLHSFLIRLVEWNACLLPAELKAVKAMALAPGEQIQITHFSRIKSLWQLYHEALFQDMDQILNLGSLRFHFQPIIQMENEQIFGNECLLRVDHPQGEPVNIGKLFEAARSNGTIAHLDREAREGAIKSAARMNLKGNIFVNFSPNGIFDPGNCLRSTEQVIQELGISPARVVFEVVESERIQDIAALKKILDYYRDNGYRVALDDTGSGYSSLKLLSLLNPDIVKIDMGIIRDIHQDRFKQAILNGIMELAREAGIYVLAEGIETREEYQYLKGQGVHLGQGYYIGRPQAIPALSQSFLSKSG